LNAQLHNFVYSASLASTSSSAGISGQAIILDVIEDPQPHPRIISGQDDGLPAEAVPTLIKVDDDLGRV
jgi:hypothetical protein